jgi:hypothetical protein
MNTKLASAFGLAMVAVAFSFSSSFACPETSHTSASVIESADSESGVNITPLAEASAPEAQVGEIVPAPSVISTIDALPTASAPPAIVSADAVPVEITETVTVVVLGQKSEDDEGATIAASGIAAIEPSVTEESTQAVAPESEAKATELSEPSGIAEAQTEVAPAAVEPPSTDLNALPAIVSVEAVPVEITETVTVVVPGQKSGDDEGATIAASGITAIEPSVTEESSQAAAPESEEKPTGIAEAQIEVAPAAVVSTDLNALPEIVSVEAVPVEITETVTVVVPGQKLQDIDDLEITGPEPEHPTAAPNLKRDEAPAALDDEE